MSTYWLVSKLTKYPHDGFYCIDKRLGKVGYIKLATHTSDCTSLSPPSRWQEHPVPLELEYHCPVNPLLNISGITEETISAMKDFCTQNGVRSVRVFGSFARGDQTPESDIDVLIEFHTEVDPDLFELGGIQQDLSDLLDRTVDLKTREMFPPVSFQRIYASSILCYPA